MPERYEFIRKVAQGGFGRVYVAKDRLLGREVAIKRLLTAEESSGQTQAEATFQREATTLAAMQHPNIVQIFDFDSDEEGTFVVMEMLEGETLKDRIDRGPLTWNTFVMVAKQALDAINAAHSQGILHRDLKPENLFLQRTPGGSRVLKILDFGLAKLSTVPSKQTMDQSGNVFGSIYYMAPEQFMRQPLDGRTDLYALGCVFYQTLSCRFPFHGESMQGTMDAHMQHKVRHIRERRPDMNASVADWIMRLISFKPADRPADVMAAIRELEAALKGEASGPATNKPGPPSGTKPGAPTGTATAAKAGPAPAPVPGPVASASSRTVSPMSPAARPGSAPVPAKPGVSSATGHGAMKTPMQARPMSALEASRLEARAKLETAARHKRLAIMIGVPVAVLVFLLVLFRSRPSSAPAPKPTPAPSAVTAAKPATPSPAPGATLPPAAPLTLPLEDALAWRFRGGVEVWSRGKDGKQPQAAAKLDQWVFAWKDVAPNAKDSWLRPYEGRVDRCCELKAGDMNGPGSRHPYLYFPTRAGMEARLAGPDASRAPGDPSAAPAGVTVAAMFRANGNSREPQMRPVLLSSSKGGLESLSLHFSHRVGQYWVVAHHNGQQAQSLVRPDQFAKSGASWSWVSAVAVWNAVDGVLSLAVRSPDGKVVRPTIPAKVPPGMPVLDRLNIGVCNLPKDSKLSPTEKMDGDIAELAIYHRALDVPTQDKVLNSIWDRYLKKR